MSEDKSYAYLKGEAERRKRYNENWGIVSDEVEALRNAEQDRWRRERAIENEELWNEYCAATQPNPTLDLITDDLPF